MVLEVRPAVDWDKGRAVRFLLDALRPAAGVPVLYLGDDRTDEDAFRALRAWRAEGAEGVIVADPPPERTAAAAYLRSPAEVATLLARLAEPL
jgi:trehalose 6-phosphate phosphatase